MSQDATELELEQKIMLHSLLQRYLIEVSSKKSPTTQARETRILNRLSVQLGSLPLLELTPLALTKFRDERLQEASASTVARDLTLLSQVIETAMERWEITLEGNPLGNVSIPSNVHGRGRELRPGERMRLVTACRRYANPMLGWVVSLILGTAMRKGELLCLQRSHVDLAARVVHLPKVGAGVPRDVPLSKTATKLFKEALLHAKETPDTPLIFFGEPGKWGQRKPYAVDRVFRQVLSRAHLRAFSCEDLRDDAIIRMREAGLTEQEVIAITALRAGRINRRAAHLQVDVLIQRLDSVGF